MFQENKARQIFRKTNISSPLIRTRTSAYQWKSCVRVRIRGVRNVRFSKNLTFLVFFKHPFWDSPFCLITEELSVILYVLWALPEEKFLSLLWFWYMLWNIRERKCICTTYIQQDAKQKSKGKTSTEDTFSVKKKQIWIIFNAYKQLMA